ncbi:MAG: alpha/beta fold hydrolase [Glycocaulis sp.]
MQDEIFVDNGSVKICAQGFGDPEGEPLLLIMGATASMLWWPHGLMEAFAKAGFYAVRFDHRDTGRSTCVPPGQAAYSIHDMADDALAVMDRFGWDSAHIAGMSLGGLLSQLIALRNPDRVRTLTLIASEIFGDPGVETRPISPEILDCFNSLGEVDWQDRDSATDFLARLSVVTGSSMRPPRLQAYAELARAEFDRAVNLLSRFNHANLDGASPWADRTHDIRTRVLVIHGDHDIVIDPAHAQAITRATPHSRLIMMEGAGHELHPDDWPEIVAQITDHAARGAA